MKAKKNYYTLIQCIDGKWHPQFGDYARKTVVDERRDYHGGNMAIPMKDMHIIESGTSQIEIDQAIAEFNLDHRRLSARELPIAAALFARSNLGMISQRDIPDVQRDVDRMLAHARPYSVGEATVVLCGHFAESDAMEETFENEARSWAKQLRNETVGELARVHTALATMLRIARPVYLSGFSNCETIVEARRLCPKPSFLERIERHFNGIVVVRLQYEPVQAGQVPYVGTIPNAPGDQT